VVVGSTVEGGREQQAGETGGGFGRRCELRPVSAAAREKRGDGSKWRAQVE
jgi:hypothetical protein